MLKFRSGLSTGLNAVRSFTTTQVAQEPLSRRVIEKLNKLGLPAPPENRPGRVLSAYNAFVRENLKTFKNQSDPTGTEGQAGLAKAFKACGEAWRELPATEKQKYLEPASKLRQEAREAYSVYLSQLTRKDFKRINEALPASARLVRPRGSSRPDGVRKPAGAFTLFCKDHTVKSGGPNMSQQTSELSVKWRAMSDEEKEPYLKAARDQRAAYKQKQEEAAGTTDGSSA